MSSFFNRQTETFDVKKRFGTSSLGVSSTNLMENRSFVAEDGQESVPESWVELAPSRASFCSSVEAMTMDEAISSVSGINKDSRLSPISLQSPHVEFESNLEQVKYRLSKDVLPKNTDWIWDWSSRPEAFPVTKYYSYNENLSNGNQQQFQGLKFQQINSTLTTPPNSPEPDLLMPSRGGFDFLPLKKSKKQSIISSFWRFEVIVGLVVSNLMTFVFGATIGFCICRKIQKSDSQSALKLEYRYW